MREKSSPSMPPPVQNIRPGEEESEERRKLQLQSVDSSGSPIFSSPFKLPNGWVVKERHRRCHPDRVDKYYIEPGTGRQFRSLKAVGKHLAGMGESSKAFEALKPGNGILVLRRETCPVGILFWKMFRIAKQIRKEVGLSEEHHELQLQIVGNSDCPIFSSPFKLPHGWVVEGHPRINSRCHPDRVDKYYIEPGTWRQFRSRRAVEKHLAGKRESTKASEAPRPDNEFTNVSFQKRNLSTLDHSLEMVSNGQSDGKRSGTMSEVLQLGKQPMPSDRHSSRKNQKSGKAVENPMRDFARPPEKVKWVLGTGRSQWSSCMGESAVPQTVQQTWWETFLLCIQEKF